MLTPNRPKDRQITEVQRKEDALVLRSEYGSLFIEPKAENIVRLRERVKEDFSERHTPGVVTTGAFGDWEYTEEEGRILLSLPKLKISIEKKSGSISFFDEKGLLLFKERDADPVEFEEFEMHRLADAPQKTRTVQTADGEKEIVEEALKVPAGKSFHIRSYMEFGEEALYGLGQQEKGFASLRGKTLYLHQANRKIALPFFVSTKGYGLLTDTYAPMVFHDGDRESYLYLEADQELDRYFIAGDMNAAVAGYRFLTGKAALLPKWAYGYVQSQERFETQQEILDTVKRSREAGIGMDCIVLDWLSWKDNEWGQKSYDPERFPDPEAMIDTLHKEHVHFMISIWPTMAGNTADHKEFAEKKLFLPACNVYDAFKEEARKLYFDQLKHTHFKYGTDAWWCDSSEPFTPEWSRFIRMEEGDLYREYCREAGLRMPYECSNAYPLFHAMGIWENQRAAMAEDTEWKEKRVCNLTRSAYTGQQRYGTIMWSGDTAASWETFRDQIAIGLHFCASGIPYWTMDIGAFFVKPGDLWYWNGRYEDPLNNKGYCELYTRWYQYGAFLPVFRAHGTDCRRELWNFGGEFYEAMLKVNRLRYELMPYIYSEAGKVWLKDRLLMRPLAFDHADDRNCREITDQYLFGEALMVCPVTEAMYFGEDGEALTGTEKKREVYFPEGCDWYDFYGGKKYSGGSRERIEAPLDRIPLFVREGSLIPCREAALSTEEQTTELILRRFGENIRPYEYYEDAGDGYGYERGEYTLTELN